MKYHLIIILLIGAVPCYATNVKGNFQQLCNNNDDMRDCVRDYFQYNGRCTVVRSADDRPVYRERHNTFLPRINLTIVTKANLTKLDGAIEEFYINKDTGNLVISINFQGIVLDSPQTYFFISQRGLEPKMLIEHANGTYPAILTAVIPINGIITANTLKKTVVNAYLPEAYVEFYIGPKVTESTDPVVMEMVAGLLADVPTAVQEIFLTEAPSYFLIYLQKYICDFGIPFTSAPTIQKQIFLCK